MSALVGDIFDGYAQRRVPTSPGDLALAYLGAPLVFTAQAGGPLAVEILSAPDGSTATATAGTVTPDVEGPWRVRLTSDSGETGELLYLVVQPEHDLRPERHRRELSGRIDGARRQAAERVATAEREEQAIAARVAELMASDEPDRRARAVAQARRELSR